MRLWLSILWALMAVSAFAERYGFDRYECILQRRMFGEVPPGFDPTKKPSEVSKSAGQKELTKEQEKLQSAIHFSVINVTPEGNVMVGFTDNSNGKEPRHYYLKVGDARDGWLVKEADPSADPQTMTIAKDGIEVSLSIGGDSAKGGGTTVRATGSQAASANADEGSARSMRPPMTLRGRRRLGQQNMQREFDAKLKQMQQESEAKEQEREERNRVEAEQREQAFAEAMNKMKEQLKNRAPQNAEGDAKDNAESKEE